jgi:hypothetical protein
MKIDMLRSFNSPVTPMFYVFYYGYILLTVVMLLKKDSD